ncbi:Major facilitator family transporter [Pseudomonas savastanoi pv. phaseolicola]|nr:Major facilitator family transporter [Pseudomonas savastanoi pv. phaseolicola]
MFNWYREVTPKERKTFWACFGGWSLDALEVQMFGLAIPALIAAFALTKGDAGLISAVTLVTSALGGWVGGTLSDRYGRVRTLQWMILWFSFFTFLSAFVTGFNQLLIIKALQGFGIGGEWAAGAVLMAETIQSRYRGKVMATVQSAWAVGLGAGGGVVYPDLFVCAGGYCLAGNVFRWPAASTDDYLGAPQRRGAGQLPAHAEKRCSEG